MTKAYVLIDPLTGRPIEERSPTIQESRSEQQFFDEQSQSFDGQGIQIGPTKTASLLMKTIKMRVQPFDLQRPTVLHSKDLNLLC